VGLLFEEPLLLHGIIELLEQKKLKKSDFMRTENYLVRLTEKASKLLIGRISLNFNRKISYKHGKNFTC